MNDDISLIFAILDKVGDNQTKEVIESMGGANVLISEINKEIEEKKKQHDLILAHAEIIEHSIELRKVLLNRILPFTKNN